jgi:hypothetical protein
MLRIRLRSSAVRQPEIYFFHTAADEPQFSTQPETTFELKSLEHAGT